VILWQNLNFWTAVGEIGVGIMSGVAVGILAKRMMRITRPPAYPGHSRICPGCGTPSLRRVRGTAAQRAFSLFTRRLPYACTRCPWPHVPVERPARKPRFTFTRSTSSSAVQPAMAEAPELVPVAAHDLAADLVLNVEPERKPVPPVPGSDSCPRGMAAAATAKAKPVEPKPAADVTPAAPKSAPQPERAPVRIPPKDDATQVKESVYQYVALLNSGDIAARAGCYLSEFTSFGIEGGPLHSNRFEGRNPGPTSTFDLRCRDLRVYIHKDTAIATAYLIGTITNANGAPIRVTGRSSWVHLRQNGEWKIVHSHLSPLNLDA
jgi:ketosteroid isomerase-like protein